MMKRLTDPGMKTATPNMKVDVAAASRELNTMPAVENGERNYISALKVNSDCPSRKTLFIKRSHIIIIIIINLCIHTLINYILIMYTNRKVSCNKIKCTK